MKNQDEADLLVKPALEQQIVTKSIEQDSDSVESEKSWRNIPWGNFLFFLFLYMAQGIVFGTNMALPIILLDRHRSLLDIAIVSQAFLPYSIKFLIAPIVDTFYINKIGPIKLGYRKCWVVSCFLASGILYLLASRYIIFLIETETVTGIDSIW